jgi:hypothetical protein
MREANFRRALIWVWSPTLALLIGGGIGAQDLAAQQPEPEMLEVPQQPRRPFTAPDWAPVPEDLDIVVVREDVIPGQFRILDVELNREITEELIAVIANLLRDADDMVYERTYIVYYLPGMRSGEIGWATSHFSPDLEVQVIGVPG